MAEPMVPCPGCRRHVRAGLCPFCGAAAFVVPVPEAIPRMSRGALFVAASVALVGCSDDTSGTPVYGAPADTGIVDTGGPAPAYGAPADTGVVDSGAVDTGIADTGSPSAAYGAPPDTGAGD